MKLKRKKIIGGVRKKKKVVVAMSGGVDSSVAAALLKGAGFDLTGIFMKFWSEPKRDGLVGAWNRCCSPEAEKRARRVAATLGIPFYVFNFEREFKKRVVDYFLAEYKTGRTPNPCVVCNKEIKFGLLLEKALVLGADFVATGHYTRLRREITNYKLQIPNYKYRLLKGKDKEKDQSYFLWQLTQDQLKHILFPIGDYTKRQVRKLAKKFRLPVFNAPESMEICFIQTTINDFLARHIRQKPGKIICLTSGVKQMRKVIGVHRGLAFYTIGQRKGIAPHLNHKWGAGGPYYVLDKNLEKNLLIVTKNKKDLYKKELTAKNINWISGKETKLPVKVKAKIRYRHQLASAAIYKLKTKNYKLIFDRPQRAITPGQSVVFYSSRSSPKVMVRGKGEELLGGGIIS